MGVGISLGPQTTWLPAGWVGRAVADYVIPETGGPSAEAVRAKLDGMFLYPGTIAFFDDAPADEVLTLLDAALRGYRKAEKTGPAGWLDPTGFPGFMRCFGGLLLYISHDLRVRPHRPQLPRGVTRHFDRPRGVFPVDQPERA